ARAEQEIRKTFHEHAVQERHLAPPADVLLDGLRLPVLRLPSGGEQGRGRTGADIEGYPLRPSEQAEVAEQVARTLVGGDGNDYLEGLNGNDQVIGGAGTDSLYGGNGDDTLVTIDGGTTDSADGGANRDTLWQD